MPPKPVPGDFPWAAKILAWLGVAINDDGSLKPEAVNAMPAISPFAAVGIAEYIRDTVGATLVAGANVTLSVDDAGDIITIAAASAITDPEVVRDTIGTALVAGSNTTITVNDAADTITVATTAMPVADTAVGSGLGIISGTTITLLTNCTLPVMRNNQNYTVICRAFVGAEGANSAIADGTISIKVGGAASVASVTQRWEAGVDTTHLTALKNIRTGTGLGIDVGVYYTGVSGALSTKFYGIEATAYPTF